MRDLLRTKTVERFAIVLPFLENRRPAQPGLRALQDQKFKQFSIIVNRHTPFLIMIGDVWFSSRPGTTRHEGDGGEQEARSKGQGGRSEERRAKSKETQKWETPNAERPTLKSVRRCD